jgi:hypothetical protein
VADGKWKMEDGKGGGSRQGRQEAAYSIGNFLRQAVLPKAVRHWTLTTPSRRIAIFSKPAFGCCPNFKIDRAQAISIHELVVSIPT